MVQYKKFEGTADFSVKEICMEYRIEHDTLGDVKVPADRKWGAQTQRSHDNFRIGRRMPMEIIRAFAVMKKCAAMANRELSGLDPDKAEVICEACDEILAGKWDEEFPLVIYQTGSGTQSNMNLNEVIAHLANEKLAARGIDKKVHPNATSINPSPPTTPSRRPCTSPQCRCSTTRCTARWTS